MPSFTHRLARPDDMRRLERHDGCRHRRLLEPYLTPEQIAASRTIMGIDTQLIDDGTYFVVEAASELAGCGGWSQPGDYVWREPFARPQCRLLDPKTEAARIRAMYTSPDFARQGVGKLVMRLCEEAARAEGFHRAELVATLAGEPLYRACGYAVIEHFSDARGGTEVPLIRMGKTL